MSHMPSAHHDEQAHDECVAALSSLQEFLHGELDENAADTIRTHLQACATCLDSFDVENAISALLRRCHPPAEAPSTLRMRITSIRVTHFDG
ncbi:zf-HC2 domain-containing protein [Aestuariimicrobium ganziense]|uniref:zf-HC2 domain-containing protein n=1 Tax=Aestuariimicrobium ganziense TaxID=2773677 RepID=UPI001F3E7DE8|nr:zf-HC2 domain-containing protein [Aestuariimicrobium ganziense]